MPALDVSAPAAPNSKQLEDEVHIDWSKVDLDRIQLPAGDDMGIHSDEEEEDEDELPQTESGFGNVIVVDHLPQVPHEKFDKLVTVVKKIFGQLGTIRDNGLWMPTDESGKTKGYAFEAVAAKENTDGYKLDKSHVFKVNMFDDFERYSKVPDEYHTPEPQPYQPKENLLGFMLDERGRDQFAIRYADETEIYWNDPKKGQPDPVYRRNCWTESFVQWSPKGTYLATVHRQGAALWGGPSWARLSRFSHQQVRLLDFSPNEVYMATYSSEEPRRPSESATVTLNIYEIRTGQLMRQFQGPAEDFAVPGGPATGGHVAWPVFKWAGGKDDKYFSKMGKNQISIYETPGMGLLDKKSLKIEGLADYSWSPSDPMMAIFVPESNGGNQPARISLIAIPSKEEVRQKNLFSVSDCKMYWQQEGAYLAVKVDRYTKTKKSVYTGFELLSVHERDIPIEVLELENKNDKIVAFAWEPKGHRFAIIHGDGPRPDVSIYTMKGSKSGRVTLLTTLKGKTANMLYWSPQGKHLILAGLKTMNGQLEFFNVDELETMAVAEHFMCTDVDWDPTGRFVATSVTSVHQMENGFNVWSFHGKLVYKMRRDRFFQYLWRPRPPSLLPPEKEQEIIKNLKRYSKRYEEEDELMRTEQDTAVLQERREALESFRKWHAERLAQRQAEREARIELRDGALSDEEEELNAEEVEVEEIIDVQEEVLYGD
eukprot:jgi/Chlat1/3289/Chrsp22S03537